MTIRPRLVMVRPILVCVLGLEVDIANGLFRQVSGTALLYCTLYYIEFMMWRGGGGRGFSSLHFLGL